MTAANSDKDKALEYQREGYEAYLTGVSRTNAPYRNGDEGNLPWIRGYNQARTDRAIENRKIT